MVDEPRVVRLLQRLSDDVSYLSSRAGSDRAALAADEDRLAALKYRFVTAIEGAVNVAQHLCAAEGWGPPADNGDGMRVLGRHGVLTAELAARLVRAVGFRNLLVNQYADVDDHRVTAALDDVGDLAAFGSQTAAWLVAQH